MACLAFDFDTWATFELINAQHAAKLWHQTTTTHTRESFTNTPWIATVVASGFLCPEWRRGHLTVGTGMSDDTWRDFILPIEGSFQVISSSAAFLFFFPLGACGEQPKYRRRRWVSGVGRFWVNISLHGNTCVPTFFFPEDSAKKWKRVGRGRRWPECVRSGACDWEAGSRTNQGQKVESGAVQMFCFFSEQRKIWVRRRGFCTLVTTTFHRSTFQGKGQFFQNEPT